MTIKPSPLIHSILENARQDGQRVPSSREFPPRVRNIGGKVPSPEQRRETSELTELNERIPLRAPMIGQVASTKTTDWGGGDDFSTKNSSARRGTNNNGISNTSPGELPPPRRFSLQKTMKATDASVATGNVSLGLRTGGQQSAGGSHQGGEAFDDMRENGGDRRGSGLFAYTAAAHHSNRVKGNLSSKRASIAASQQSFRSLNINPSLHTVSASVPGSRRASASQPVLPKYPERPASAHPCSPSSHDNNKERHPVSPISSPRRKSSARGGATISSMAALAPGAMPSVARRERAHASGQYSAFCRAADRVSWVASGMGGAGATGGNIVGIHAFWDTSCYYKVQHGRPPKPQRVGPGALVLIYQFYAKLQAPAAQYGKSLGFTEQHKVNASLSFFELLTLLRDYAIVPQIVGKREVFALWNALFQEKAKKAKRAAGRGKSAGAGRAAAAAGGGTGTGGQRQTDLGYEDFVDMLSRIALLGFGKPGFRREVEAAEAAKHGLDLPGGRPAPPQVQVTPRAKVEFLASLLPLKSAEAARRRLRTQGRATQGRLNARCKGEASAQNAAEMRRYRQLERLSRLMAEHNYAGGEDLVQKHAAALTKYLADGEEEIDSLTSGDRPPTVGVLHFGERDRVRSHRQKLRTGNVLAEGGGPVGPDGLTAFQRGCLAEFSRDLRAVWAPFKHEESVHLWAAMPGPYLDLGALLRGRAYSYRLRVTNLTPGPVGVEVRPREGGALAAALTLTAAGRPVPHGLTQTVRLELDAGALPAGECFTFLDVAVAGRGGGELVHSVPVYFRALLSREAFGPEAPALHPPGLHRPNRFQFPDPAGGGGGAGGEEGDWAEWELGGGGFGTGRRRSLPALAQQQRLAGGGGGGALVGERAGLYRGGGEEGSSASSSSSEEDGVEAGMYYGDEGEGGPLMATGHTHTSYGWGRHEFDDHHPTGL